MKTKKRLLLSVPPEPLSYRPLVEDDMQLGMLRRDNAPDYRLEERCCHVKYPVMLLTKFDVSEIFCVDICAMLINLNCFLS